MRTRPLHNPWLLVAGSGLALIRGCRTPEVALTIGWALLEAAGPRIGRIFPPDLATLERIYLPAHPPSAAGFELQRQRLRRIAEAELKSTARMRRGSAVPEPALMNGTDNSGELHGR